MVGSIALFCGAKLGRSLVRMLALLMAVSCVAEIFIFELPAEWRVWCGVVALFSLVSIVLLNSPPNTKPNAAVE